MDNASAIWHLLLQVLAQNEAGIRSCLVRILRNAHKYTMDNEKNPSLKGLLNFIRDNREFATCEPTFVKAVVG